MQDIMGVNDIAFPNLGLYLKNVPQGFTIFGFYISLYGVIIAIGVMAGISMAARLAKKTGQNPDDYWDFSIYAVIFSLIGARIYYVVFEWDSYKNNLLEIFHVRGGGLAIYGGVIAAFITLFVWCRIKKKDPRQMGDTAMAGLLLGQIIGRWGNFTNREVFGEYTEGLLAMRIPLEAVRDRTDITDNISSHIAQGTNYIQVHPTFFYESALNLLLMIVVLLYYRHKKFQGEICLLYLGGYGIIRFFVEGIRTDQLKFAGTNVAVSQVLGITLFVAALLADVGIRIFLLQRQGDQKKKSS
ncbi:MAG: prolipoprotein diacylglyceryl transferase [bacterium]|nr:prolipoprotein diacylglyceryl transferase [bacterium]MCM1376396.1 prolipoprotein diacylglyceryl transferase [Muribaculum sp.]